MAFAEDNYENAVIQLFEQLGYGYVYGPNVVRDYTEVLYLDELEPALLRINPSLPSVAIDEAINKLQKKMQQLGYNDITAIVTFEK